MAWISLEEFLFLAQSGKQNQGHALDVLTIETTALTGRLLQTPLGLCCVPSLGKKPVLEEN